MVKDAFNKNGDLVDDNDGGGGANYSGLGLDSNARAINTRSSNF